MGTKYSSVGVSTFSLLNLPSTDNSQMYFTNQVEYITRYINTYGDIIDQYEARAALKFHFGVSFTSFSITRLEYGAKKANGQRLLAEGRLRPAYQSTPSYLSIEERTDMQNTSALKVFNAICQMLNAHEPPRRTEENEKQRNDFNDL
jgi:hypothetical protein